MTTTDAARVMGVTRAADDTSPPGTPEEEASSYSSTDETPCQVRFCGPLAAGTDDRALAAARLAAELETQTIHWWRRAHHWLHCARTFQELLPAESQRCLEHALKCRAAAHERARWAAHWRREVE